MQIIHVTWSAQEARESKIDHTNAIYSYCAEHEARKVQWLDLRHTHTQEERERERERERENVCIFGARNEMMMDDYDGQMIFGDLVGLKLPDIRLTGEEKPRKNLTQETCPDR